MSDDHRTDQLKARRGSLARGVLWLFNYEVSAQLCTRVWRLAVFLIMTITTTLLGFGVSRLADLAIIAARTPEEHQTLISGIAANNARLIDHEARLLSLERQIDKIWSLGVNDHRTRAP